MTQAKLVSIFLDNYKELSLYTVKLTVDKSTAEDLLSKLVLDIYTEPKFLEVENPLAYFKTCLHNHWVNDKKKYSRVQHLDQEILETLGYTPEEFETTISDRETKNLLNKVFEKYSPELIEAFVKFHLEGYSVNSLAAELGMCPNTLSQHFSRMRRKLRDRAPALWNMIMLVFLSRGGV